MMSSSNAAIPILQLQMFMVVDLNIAYNRSAKLCIIFKYTVEDSPYKLCVHDYGNELKYINSIYFFINPSLFHYR